ncbi:MAG: hypothetical protein P1U53_15215 [Sulfitobacter sp.]|nr:hypothetical protein [Sulfitobacter sp.]
MADKAAPKKRVGRPPAAPPVPDIQVEGVVGEPQKSPANCFEMCYNSPTTVAHLIKYLKGADLNQITFHATPTVLDIFANSETGSVPMHVLVKLDSAKLNRYFCQKELWFTLHRSDLEKFFAKIDRSFHVIWFSIREGKQMTMSVSIENLALSNEISFDVPIERVEQGETRADKFAPIDEHIAQAHLSWTVPFKALRKTLEMFSVFDTEMQIEKSADTKLQLLCRGSAGQPMRETYKNEATIELKSEVKAGSVFQQSFTVQALRNLISMPDQANTHVKIFCRENLPLLIKAKLGLFDIFSSLGEVV